MKSRFFLLPMLTVLMLTQTACGTLSSRVLDDSTEAVERLQHGGTLQAEVDALARPLVEEDKIKGLVVGVVEPGGGLETFEYGVAPDAIVQIGSVSKLFVAALYAILVEQGRLRPDETVREILGPSVAFGPSVGNITLQELATHTSGLPREKMGWDQFRDFIRYVFTGKNIYGYLDREFLYRNLERGKIKPHKRGKYQYSNLGMALLAHLIEVKTGQQFESLARAEIFEPLGMQDTTFDLTPAQKKRLVRGHAGKNQPYFLPLHAPIEPWEMSELVRPTGGLYSTAEDLLRFLHAVLGQTEFAHQTALAKMLEIQVETPAEAIALGWRANRFDDGAIVLHYLHGMISGYSAYIGLNAEQKRAAVVLMTNFEWEDRVGHNLLLRLSRARRI